jgi:citrate lyase subunit beta/citryl-CoA lyase
MLERALGVGEFRATALDVAILDLEDSVPIAEQDVARAAVSEVLSVRANDGKGPSRFARVHRVGSEHFLADLDAAMAPGIDAIVLPKVESIDEIWDAVSRIDALERSRGMAKIGVLPSIESALGLIRAHDIAGSNVRVVGLLFGGEDYALDLGLPADRTGEASELLFARSSLVNAATAAGLPALDGVWTAIKDLDGLRNEARQARRIGFRGKSAIHPGHVSIINETFSPTSAEVAHARRVVSAFEAGVDRHQGAVALDGKMIDRPVVERARRLLDSADLP